MRIERIQEAKAARGQLICGIHAVTEAIRADKEIDKVLIKREADDFTGRGALSDLLALLRERGIPVQRIPNAGLNRLTNQEHQGVVAFLSVITYQRLEDIIPFVYEQGRDPFIVLLDGITDVRNFGALARTCECAGVDAIVIPARKSVSVNADAMKTSAGALNIIPVCKERSINDAIRYLRQCGVTVVATTEKAAETYTTVNYNAPLALVMGAEDVGIAPENLRICDHIVKIPQFGSIGSLNVSVAAAVVIYEAIRQRNK